jgi:hypothetical protein
MTGKEFRKAHNRHLKKAGVPRKEEHPQTWLMAESGFYFPLEGDLDCELKRLREMEMPCTVHHGQTSITMSRIQETHERK